jgi:hypothetical protein
LFLAIELPNRQPKHNRQHDDRNGDPALYAQSRHPRSPKVVEEGSARRFLLPHAIVAITTLFFLIRRMTAEFLSEICFCRSLS